MFMSLLILKNHAIQHFPASAHLVSCEPSWTNLATADKILSVISLIPDNIRPGPMCSTTSDKCWAVHLLTAVFKWLVRIKNIYSLEKYMIIIYCYSDAERPFENSYAFYN